MLKGFWSVSQQCPLVHRFQYDAACIGLCLIYVFLSPAQATDFIKRNIVLSSGFVGGFLLGLAS